MNDQVEKNTKQRRRRVFSLQSIFLSMLGIFSSVFILIMLYAYYDMNLISSSSASLTENSLPRIMSAQRSLINLERLRSYINIVKESSDIRVSRSAYIDASALLTEQLFDVEEVASLSDNVLSRVRQLWQCRTELNQTRSELTRAGGSLALNIYHIELEAGLPNRGLVYVPPEELAQHRVSTAGDEHYAAAQKVCGANPQGDLAIQCRTLPGAKKDFERALAAYQTAERDLIRRHSEIEFLLNLMSSAYTQNETLIISEELNHITSISHDLLDYLILIFFLVLVSCFVLYITIYSIMVRPLQKIAHFITRFTQMQDDESPHELLPDTQVLELSKIVSLLRRLFENVQKMTDDSERITQRYTELLTISYYDELTGAHNRRALELFNRTVGKLPSRFAVMMVDIDLFKKFNDTLGHQKGDAVLRRISLCLIKNTSEADIVYRYGGEEFCIVLQNVDKPILASIGRRLCHSVKQLDISNPGNHDRPVTISIGISPPTTIRGQWTLEEMIAMADTALYEAKRQGRERFVFYDQSQEGKQLQTALQETADPGGGSP